MESISISTYNTGPLAFGGFLTENKREKESSNRVSQMYMPAGAQKGTRICAKDDGVRMSRQIVKK